MLRCALFFMKRKFLSELVNHIGNLDLLSVKHFRGAYLLVVSRKTLLNLVNNSLVLSESKK